MAFPQVASSAVSVEASNVTSHTTTMPASIDIGDLLLAFITSDSTSALSAFTSGWTVLKNIHSGSCSPSVAILYREAVGSDALVFTTAANQQSTHQVYRITGAEAVATQAPEVSTDANKCTPDSVPNSTSLTPTGGAKDYLFFTFEGNDANVAATGYPTNYSNGVTKTSATSGGTNTGVARRELNATSDDPGDFTLASDQEWRANTVVVHPSSVTAVPINFGGGMVGGRSRLYGGLG